MCTGQRKKAKNASAVPEIAPAAQAIVNNKTDCICSPFFDKVSV
jgi:hypothetical protein